MKANSLASGRSYSQHHLCSTASEGEGLTGKGKAPESSLNSRPPGKSCPQPQPANGRLGLRVQAVWRWEASHFPQGPLGQECQLSTPERLLARPPLPR